MTQTELVALLSERVGRTHVLTERAAMAPYLAERRNRFHGRSAAVVRPGSTEQVAAVVGACAAKGVDIIPQGGNTGLCGGAAPDATGAQVIVSLERLDRIRRVDPDDFTLTAEAGCVLADVQAAAERVDRLFPLAYAAEHECRLGGNLATNAGGMNVLRYGNARDLTLGLEVVLPDGRIWNGLRRLRKDNSGYDLKDLFIGAEGTLGIITAAVVRLFPRPRRRFTVLAGVADVDRALGLLGALREATGDAVTAFEFIGRMPMSIVVRHDAHLGEPLAEAHDWYVLADVDSFRDDDGMASALGERLEALRTDGTVADFRLAETAPERDRLWAYRRRIPALQKREGGSIKHDVSVPVSSVPAFLAAADEAVADYLPGARPCAFGHLGDGNVHYNITQPPDMAEDAFLAHWEAMNRVVHDVVQTFDGSFAAEHGVGRLKVDEVARLKSPVERDLMRALKDAIDPAGHMNPACILPRRPQGR